MARTWRQEFRRQFEERIQEEFPEFTRDPEGEKLVPGGVFLYRHGNSPGKAVFIALVFSPKRGCITVEGAWSQAGTYPSHSLPLPIDINRQDPDGRVDVGSLLPGSPNDHWWWVRNHRIVTPIVDEAIAAVETYLIPLLDKIHAEG